MVEPKSLPEIEEAIRTKYGEDLQLQSPFTDDNLQAIETKLRETPGPTKLLRTIFGQQGSGPFLPPAKFDKTKWEKIKNKLKPLPPPPPSPKPPPPLPVSGANASKPPDLPKSPKQDFRKAKLLWDGFDERQKATIQRVFEEWKSKEDLTIPSIPPEIKAPLGMGRRVTMQEGGCVDGKEGDETENDQFDKESGPLKVKPVYKFGTYWIFECLNLDDVTTLVNTTMGGKFKEETKSKDDGGGRAAMLSQLRQGKSQELSFEPASSPIAEYKLKEGETSFEDGGKFVDTQDPKLTFQAVGRKTISVTRKDILEGVQYQLRTGKWKTKSSSVETPNTLEFKVSRLPREPITSLSLVKLSSPLLKEHNDKNSKLFAVDLKTDIKFDDRYEKIHTIEVRSGFNFQPLDVKNLRGGGRIKEYNDNDNDDEESDEDASDASTQFSLLSTLKTFW